MARKIQYSGNERISQSCKMRLFEWFWNTLQKSCCCQDCLASQILGWVVKFFLLLVSSRLVRMTLDMQWSLLEKQTLAWTNLFSNFDHLLLTRRKILAWMMTAKGGVVDWFPFLSSLDTKWSLLEKQTLAWITLFSNICYYAPAQIMIHAAHIITKWKVPWLQFLKWWFCSSFIQGVRSSFI